jgi:hypothetical protein
MINAPNGTGVHVEKHPRANLFDKNPAHGFGGGQEVAAVGEPSGHRHAGRTQELVQPF